LFLKFRFQDCKFTQIWRCLQDAGWTYSATTRAYSSPVGTARLVWESSRAVVEYLDRYALPPVVSNLQCCLNHHDDSANVASTTNDTIDEENTMALWKQHRLDVLKHWLERFGNNDDDDSEEEEETVAHPSKDSNESGITRQSTRRSARIPHDPNRSITMAEKGSNMYLEKKLASSKKRKKATLIPPSDMPMSLPTVQDCIAFAQQAAGTVSMNGNEFNGIDADIDYHRWKFLLSTNHSLLFFGMGCKRHIVNEFATRVLELEGPVLTINGFDPSVNISDLLELLTRLFLNKRHEPSSESLTSIPLNRHPDIPIIGLSNPWMAHGLVEQSIYLGRRLALEALTSLRPLTLVIHNMEGSGLCNPMAQTALAALHVNSRVSNGCHAVRLVATVDHVDAPLHLWDTMTRANVSWIYVPLHTHHVYTEELVMTKTVVSNTADAKMSLKDAMMEDNCVSEKQYDPRVLEQLAPRHAEVVHILARLQLQALARDKESQGWIPFPDYRDACKASCAIANDAQLHRFIGELEDHELIAQTKHNRKHMVRVPHSIARLKEILARKR
jgi:hypothetical protein